MCWRSQGGGSGDGGESEQGLDAVSEPGGEDTEAPGEHALAGGGVAVACVRGVAEGDGFLGG